MASSRPQAHSLNEKERQDALAAMDLQKIVKSYILSIVSAPGYKALICDKETMRVACTLLGEETQMRGANQPISIAMHRRPH